MSVQALQPRAWALIVLAAWAAVASLGIAGYAVWTARVQGNLQAARVDLDEAERVNKSMRQTVSELRTDLRTCEEQWSRSETRAARDLIAQTAEIEELKARLQETRNEIATALRADPDPDLSRCLPVRVPGDVYDQLQDAADRASRAHRSGAPGVDPDPGAPDQPAGGPDPAGDP